VHRAGNALSEDLGTEAHDVVFMAAVVHHFDGATNQQLMGRIAPGAQAERHRGDLGAGVAGRRRGDPANPRLAATQLLADTLLRRPPNCNAPSIAVSIPKP